MNPEEKRLFEGLVDLRHHIARMVERYEPPASIWGGLFKKTPKYRIQDKIAAEIRNIDLEPFYCPKPPPLMRDDRVRVKESAGFSRGSEGTVKYVTPNGEIWVERDGSGSDMFFHREELELIE